jgi:hypothetical protein
LTRARVVFTQNTAEVKRIIACVEVEAESLAQVCYDVAKMSPHHQVLWLRDFLSILRDKLAVLMNNHRELQKFKQLKEYKALVEELLKEDRYVKVLEVLFVVSYPEVLQQLEQQQSESKMHT